jgi:serpin B
VDVITGYKWELYNTDKDFSQADDLAAKMPQKLYVSKVLHKAFMEVNEKGTEAAAATAVLMARPTEAVPQSVPFTPTFRADRPFVFLIRDVRTGSILFVGRLMNPRQDG